MLPVKEAFQHRNIVEYEKDFCLQYVHDQVTEIYILMEFLPGLSLYDVVSERRFQGFRGDKRALRESETRHVLKHVASALMYLHDRDKPILHLDLNAANVRLNIMNRGGEENARPDRLNNILHKQLISSDINQHALQVKLIDFGCAAKLCNANQTKEGQFTRSLTHLAPEQLPESAFEISKATDVFLFGCLVYMCLLASPPFGNWEDACVDERNSVVFKDKLKNGKFEKPDNKEYRCWDDLSAEAQALVGGCLNPSPKERPQSIKEVLQDPWWKMTSDPPERQSATKAKPMLPMRILGRT